MDRVRLIPTTERDQPLLEAWLAREHVRTWWGDPQKVLSELAHWKGDQAMIESGGRKVGYTCWGHPTREELDEAGLSEISTDVIDIDILIGEEDAVGKGIGPSALMILIENIFDEDASIPAIMAGTSASNKASIKGGVKAGFRIKRFFDDPEIGPAVLLWRDR